MMRFTDFDNSKDTYRNVSTKINANSSKEYSNSSLDYMFCRSNKELNIIKNYNMKDKPNFLTKNIIINDIDYIDRRCIRIESESLVNRQLKNNNADDENIFSNNLIEKDKLIESFKISKDMDLNKKIKQHKVEKIIDSKIKENPNDRKIFENLLKKISSNNQIGTSSTALPNLKSNVLKPTNLKRIMSISPYSTIPNRVKYSWVNNPNIAQNYEPKLPRSLIDSEGNRFKHVSHGSSTIYFKDKVQKYDLLRNLLDFNVDLHPQFRKAVKIKNIRNIIKTKTSIRYFFDPVYLFFKLIFKKNFHFLSKI